jgi:ATP-dependent RNA helicase RhlE
MSRAIVFTRTKHGANKLAEQLEKDGFGTAAIHGNKSQGARQQALNAFKNGKVKVLVATDIAARGIDVDGISHVVNYELPMEPEGYVHRIGRTARAGATGIALTLCDSEERGLLRDIERITRTKVPVVENHPFVGVAEEPRTGDDRDRIPAHHRGGNRGQHSKRPGQGARKSANGTSHRGRSNDRSHAAGANAVSHGSGGEARSGESRSGQPRSHHTKGQKSHGGENRGGQHRSHAHGNGGGAGRSTGGRGRSR